MSLVFAGAPPPYSASVSLAYCSSFIEPAAHRAISLSIGFGAGGVYCGVCCAEDISVSIVEVKELSESESEDQLALVNLKLINDSYAYVRRYNVQP
jgi:hypothetical protein